MTTLKSAEKILNDICEGVAGHTPDCICQRCKKGQEAFLLEDDVRAIQINALEAAAEIVQTTPVFFEVERSLRESEEFHHIVDTIEKSILAEVARLKGEK